MRRRILVAAVAGAVVLGGGGIAVAQSLGGSGHYRTATASIGDVDSTLSLSGTVAASSRRDLTFGTGGTVTSVGVDAGDTVKPGQTLATLDAEGLDAAVIRAEAAVAKAKAQLETDQSSQSSSVAAAASSPSSSGGSKPSGSSTPTTSPAVGKALARLKQQQDAVRAAQTAATEAISAAKAAVAARADACAATEPEPDGDAPEETTSDACAKALAAAEAAQDDVADKQDVLQKALQDLDATLTSAIKALGSSSGTPRPSDDSSSSSTGSDRSGGNGGSSPSAGSLAQDQAAVDTAEAELTEAKIARKAATLTAPFAGTVLDVSVATGDSVSSSDVAVILVGDGGTTVTTSVTVEQVAKVKVGQIARVTPAGFDQAVDGTVTSIGMLPTTGNDSTTYPVTIDLADDVTAPEGSGASVILVTATAKDVVTVPSSAVTTNGARSTVSLLKNGEPTTVRVTVGAVGSSLTEVKNGVTKGQEVVLADLDAALPTSDQSGGGRFRSGLGGQPSFNVVRRGPAG